MKTYRLGMQAFQQLRRRLICGGLLSGVAVIASLSYLMIFPSTQIQNPFNEGEPLTSSRILSTLVFMVIGGVFLAFALYRQYKTQSVVLQSTEITIGPHYVSRQQPNIPKMMLKRSEIRYIEDAGESLCLRTDDKYRSIAVPKSIDGFAEIEQTLHQWEIPFRQDVSRPQILGILVGITLLVGFGILFFVQVFWIVLIVWLCLMIFYGYYYWLLHRSQGTDPKFRRNMLFVLLFIGIVGILKLVALYRML